MLREINPEAAKVQRIKDLMCVWAAWVAERAMGGYPAQCAFATERVQDSNRSTDTYHIKAPEHCEALDEHIEKKLAPAFKNIVRMEYMDKRPTRVKAAVLQIPTQVYYQRLSFIHTQLSFLIFAE